jgi:phytoene desaturase
MWPTKPLFYASAPTKTDASIAPEGCENMFLLMPTAPGLDGDSEEVREKYYHLMMDRLEAYTGESIRDRVVVKRSFAYSDFKSEYNSFKGNAYGLANTLDQTAIFKPRLKSKKVANLYFAGQLTTPGPGVPPSLISGEVVCGEIVKDYSLKKAV